MPNFAPDQVTFKDLPGYGLWDTGHYREHLQFVQVLAGQTPPVLLPNYDVSSMLSVASSRRAAIEAHQEVHQLLSAVSGITAPDFSQFNLDEGEDFYSFLSYHSTTHQQLRQFLGIT